MMNFYEICVILYCAFLVENVYTQGSDKGQTSSAKSGRQSVLICPSKSKPVPFLALPCGSNNDCRIMGANSKTICCRTRCVEGEPLISQNEIQQSATKTTGVAKALASPEWVCPPKASQIPFIAIPCSISSNCGILGTGFVCCRNRCVQGVPPPSRLEFQHDRENEILQASTLATAVAKTRRSDLTCPSNASQARLAVSCGSNVECGLLGPTLLCCENRCVQGISAPVRIELPIQQLNEIQTSLTKAAQAVKARQQMEVVCPSRLTQIPFIALPCRSNNDCTILGIALVCCENICVEGIRRPARIELPPEKQNKIQQPSPRATQLVQAMAQSNLVCPTKVSQIPFLALPCRTNNECDILGSGMVCCENTCVQGIQSPVNIIEVSRQQNENAIQQSSAMTTQAVNVIEQRDLVCPNTMSQVTFIAFPCSSNRECAVLGSGFACCRGRCVQGVSAQARLQLPHQSILFGLVERICPADPIPELSEIRECKSDLDCDPRICCPDKPNTAGQIKFYCRTAAANLDKLPAPKMIVEPLKTAVSYMQCTPPPPANLDLFPKPCESSFDCFPNLCCQENGRRYCRPPKRSVLALLAEVTQRLGTSDLARRAIERITT